MHFQDAFNLHEVGWPVWFVLSTDTLLMAHGMVQKHIFPGCMLVAIAVEQVEIAILESLCWTSPLGTMAIVDILDATVATVFHMTMLLDS